MPIYEFKCVDGHVTDMQLPMSSETREINCPDCGSQARRLISAPSVRRVDAGLASAVEATQKSAYEPQVVSSLPSAGNARVTKVTHNPQHAKLPRP
ncbi:zinc ribbon domain-containing protein [Corynebacterium sp. Q4381]|uniref:FmdB family zinc ribbon protein n=1 Tax=Corynebacterium sp. Marseille-Q4381 TaxID=3121597 RepID=UPI002FE517D6